LSHHITIPPPYVKVTSQGAFQGAYIPSLKDTKVDCKELDVHHVRKFIMVTRHFGN
jgi:hypothetical protein